MAERRDGLVQPSATSDRQGFVRRVPLLAWASVALLTLAVAVPVIAAAVVRAAPARHDSREAAETAPDRRTRVEVRGERDEPGVVCPGIILGKGVDLTVTIPCGRGAKILEAEAVDVHGRFCAEVTYASDADSPPRTETLCEGDVPSIGGEPVRGPLSVAG